jgi:hypothetical protein
MDNTKPRRIGKHSTEEIYILLDTEEKYFLLSMVPFKIIRLCNMLAVREMRWTKYCAKSPESLT